MHRVISLLEAVRLNPQMYIGKADNPEAMQHFLGGIFALYSDLSDFDYTIFRDIAVRHGWKGSSILFALKTSQLSKEEMVIELVDISIEAYKQLCGFS